MHLVRKTMKGFKCQLSSKELPGKVAILDHLKISHPDLAKFFPKLQRSIKQDKPMIKSQIVNVIQKILEQNCENVKFGIPEILI